MCACVCALAYIHTAPLIRSLARSLPTYAYACAHASSTESTELYVECIFAPRCVSFWLALLFWAKIHTVFECVLAECACVGRE